MVAPAYATDLSDITLGEELGTWVELADHKGGGAPSVETDYYIQGNSCISQSTGTSTGTNAGMGFDFGSPIAIKQGDVFTMWQVVLAGNATTSFQQGGLRFGIGSANNAYYFWKVGGEDFGRNPYGGWQNVAVDPTFPPDYTEGSPVAGTYQWFGSLINLKAAISKGNPHGVDPIRWGRGRAICSGGNLGDGYCNFFDLALENDLQANRWGLFQSQAGVYLTKGIIQIGTGHDATATPTSASFFDSNRVITIDNTPRTYRDFNKVEIRNTGTFCYWNNIQMAPVSAGGSLSRGIFDVVDNPTGESYGYSGLILENCIFADMFDFYFQPNCTSLNTTFRRCGTIRQNSSIFNGCTIINSPSAIALLSNNIENIYNCNFESAGTGHAIELTDAHIQGSSYTLTNTTFTGYAAVSGGTRNEAIYNNSGNLITLYIVGGDYPSIRNGEDADTIIIQATTYTLTGVVSGSEIQIVPQDWYLDGTVSPDEDLYHLENTTIDDGSGHGTTQATYTYSYTGDIPIYVYILKLGYEWTRVSDTLTNTNKSVPVSQKIDRIYDNPA